MGAVFLKILNMSLTAVWLILAVILVRLLFRKAPKFIRCILWGLVAFRLICPFSIESELSLIPLTDGSSHQDIQVTIKSNELVREYKKPDGITVQYYDNEPKELLELSIYDPIGKQVLESGNKDVNPISVFAYIWLIGIVGIITYSIISYVILRKRVRTAAYIWNRIWISDEVETPFIFGIRNPRIYLPSAMDEETGNQVISHEQAHVRRKDYVWKPIGFFITCVHWFNPLVWLAYVLFSRDIELACDEKVIKGLNGDEKKLYSKALVACSVPHRIISACPVAFGELGVKRRVKAVLDYKKPAVWIIVASIITSAVVLVCFLTDPKENLQYNDTTYAVGVNGTVTIDEFDIVYNSLMEEGYTENAAERRAKEYCFKQEALYQYALREGFSASDEEVTDYVQGVKESFSVDENGKIKLAEYIEKYGTEDAYYEFVAEFAEKEIIRKKYKDELSEKYIDSQGYIHSHDLDAIATVLAENEDFEVIEENLREYMDNKEPAEYKAEKTKIEFANYSFRVNSSMPEYAAYVYYDEKDIMVSKQVIIKEKATQKLIQRFDIVENERFSEEFIYFADINFDGNNDLLIPRIRNASSVFFAAYLYSPEHNQFIYTESFDDIRNFILDVENERILSRNAADGVTTHYMHKFNDITKEFVLSNYLYIGRDFGNTEYVSNMRVIEKRYDENNMEEVVNDVVVESDELIDTFDGSFGESAISQYYEEGSFWNLNNDIWSDEYYD